MQEQMDFLRVFLPTLVEDSRRMWDGLVYVGWVGIKGVLFFFLFSFLYLLINLSQNDTM